MRKIHIIILLFIVCITANAQNITYNNADKQKIEQLLTEAIQMPASTNWMMHFAKKFYDCPYVGGTLDKADTEKLVVNTRQLDCTTYVETVLALSVCAKNKEKTFNDYCRHLREVRYADGDVKYIKRQHYFTVWMNENAKQGIVQIIEPSGITAPFTAIQTVSIDYMSTHVSSYKMLTKHPEWLAGIKSMENSVTGKKYLYIPKALTRPTPENNKQLKKYINDGDIIAIVTNKKGLDTTHIGIASWHKDGLHLINASSIHKKVIDEPMTFYNYTMKHPSQIGIRICRMK